MASDRETLRLNLKMGVPSRKKQRAGDLFALDYGEIGFVYGRVVDPCPFDDGGIMGESRLVYVYDLIADALDGEYDSKAVSPNNLLISPLLVNRTLWSYGGALPIANVPLDEGDLLATHCFRIKRGPDHDQVSYIDETRTRLPGPIEPVIDFVLGNIRTIDLRVSEALNIPQRSD